LPLAGLLLFRSSVFVKRGRGRRLAPAPFIELSVGSGHGILANLWKLLRRGKGKENDREGRYGSFGGRGCTPPYKLDEEGMLFGCDL
jgi:hypothetical protein